MEIEDAKNKTRFEQNKEMLDALSEVFVTPVAEQFRCVFRPKARGKGVMINTEKISDLSDILWHESKQIRTQAESQALEQMGLQKFKQFYIYEKINPEHLSEEALKEKWETYNKLKDQIKSELLATKIPELEVDALCVQIGEELKSLERGSWIPVNALMGPQTTFLSRQKQSESSVIASTFFGLIKKGNISLNPETEEQISPKSMALSIASAETVARIGREKNAVLRRIINPKLMKPECVKLEEKEEE